MPFTRRQQVNARRSREMGILSDFDNIDVVQGEENFNCIEGDLADTTNSSVSHIDTEAFSHSAIKGMRYRELTLYKLAVRVGRLRQIDCWNPWKRYQGN